MAQKTSMRDGRWTKKYPFKYSILQETAAAGVFDGDSAKTDIPTGYLTTKNPDTLKSGMINRIHFRIKAANTETYTLYIWQASEADNYKSNMNLLYESPSGRASDTDYDITELDIPFILAAEGKIYYSLNWSGASGNVQGFIEVSGETYE